MVRESEDAIEPHVDGGSISNCAFGSVSFVRLKIGLSHSRTNGWISDIKTVGSSDHGFTLEGSKFILCAKRL